MVTWEVAATQRTEMPACLMAGARPTKAAQVRRPGGRDVRVDDWIGIRVGLAEHSRGSDPSRRWCSRRRPRAQPGRAAALARRPRRARPRADNARSGKGDTPGQGRRRSGGPALHRTIAPVDPETKRCSICAAGRGVHVCLGSAQIWVSCTQICDQTIHTAAKGSCLARVAGHSGWSCGLNPPRPPGWLGGLRYARSHASGWTASRSAALTFGQRGGPSCVRGFFVGTAAIVAGDHGTGR